MAVFGCGTIGLFVIMVARALGATRVIGIEPNSATPRWPASWAPTRCIQLEVANAAKNGWCADKDLVQRCATPAAASAPTSVMEMAGFNSSVNNAIQSTRRGGDVILFGLKQGNFHIQAFDRMIVNGIGCIRVIGRRIFGDWYITRNLLEDRSNRIQDRIYEEILGGGEASVVHIDEFTSSDSRRPWRPGRSR